MNITILIVAVTCVISFIAFNNATLLQNLVFYPYRMWRNNEWHRWIASGFIHGSAMHLLFNMITLYSFGLFVEGSFVNLFESNGRLLYVILYFGAVLAADLSTLFKEKNNQYYTSLGASGGVAAIIFASILMNPFAKMYIMFIPVGIPAFVFGPLYIIYCIYMDNYGHQHKTGFNMIDNAAHAPHLWGSVFGFVFPIIFEPRLFMRFVNLLTNGAIG